MKSIARFALLAAVALLASVPGTARAAVPPFINYHGFVTNSGGVPLNGPVDIGFALFADSLGGSPLWQETHAGVEVSGGAFAVLLGAATPLDPGTFSGAALWLETTIDDTTLTPRRPLVSVGYAFRSDVAALAEGLASGGPLVVRTADSRSGCPPFTPINTDLVAQSLNLTASATVLVTARMIRNATGRSDLVLYVDGVSSAAAITYTPTQQWTGANITWSGTLAAGAHTISLRCPDNTTAWGCGSLWGAIDTIVFK